MTENTVFNEILLKDYWIYRIFKKLSWIAQGTETI